MDDLEAQFRRATDLHRRGRFAQAAEGYRQILAQEPGLHRAKDNLALASLGAGDYATGFELYEGRFAREAGQVPRPSLSFPEWRGEALAGRSILIWPEQGYGDQIMYARFAPVLAAQGAKVTMLVARPLKRLFSSLPVEILEASGQVTMPRHDYWIMGASLPHRLGVTLETLPAGPYLPSREGAGVGVGVAWHGDERHPVNHLRSLPPEQRDRLLALPGARSLHPEDSGARDFQDTADLIDQVARVITVDTSVAHLAGAMGKSVWVLLSQENACWRWLSDRGDSPWYRSMRLFRQRTQGDWAAVLDEVVAAQQEA